MLRGLFAAFKGVPTEGTRLVITHTPTVADKLPEEQRGMGFAMQSFFIGVGAVVAGLLPYILRNWFHVSSAADGMNALPTNVKISFYIGAIAFLTAVLWTVFSSPEDPPADLEEFRRRQAGSRGLAHLVREIPAALAQMPGTMRRLALVQFFSWFALFSMWVYTTPAVALKFYGTTDANSSAFQDAGNWVGILFGVYNGVSAIIALSLPMIAKRLSKKVTHSIALCIGGLSLLSFLLFTDPHFLITPLAQSRSTLNAQPPFDFPAAFC